jgi:mono/diheme cytochrome c family protein
MALATLASVAGLLLGSTLLADSVRARPIEFQSRPQRVDHQSGAYLYRVYCIACHGETGRGDGPVADLLKKAPPDLTRITVRAGGTFPRDIVIQQIDGRQAVPAHGRQDMPVWGDTLKSSEGRDERVIAQRIVAIAAHIESLQVR